MSKLSERAAYIKGLADGLNISEKGEQGKVLSAMIELMQDITGALEYNQATLEDLEEAVDTLSDDVADLEETVYELDEEDAEEYLADDDFVEFECPHCGDTIYYDADLVESQEDLICPSCNKPVIIVSTDEPVE